MKNKGHDMAEKTGVSLLIYVRVVVCVALTSLSVLFMNQMLFPLFDDIFTYARDISITCSSAFLILVALCSMVVPQVFRFTRIYTIGLGAVVAGAALMPVALSLHDPVMLVLAACIVSCARVWATLCTNLSLVEAAGNLPRWHVLGLVGLGYCISTGLDQLAQVLPISIVCIFDVCIFPCAMVLLSVRGAREIYEELRTSPSAFNMSVTRPASVLPLGDALYILQFLMSVIFGFAMRFAEVDGSPASGQFISFLVLSILLLSLVSLRNRVSFDSLWLAILLIILAGFFLVVSGLQEAAFWSNSILIGGNSLYKVLLVSTLIMLAARNRRNAVSVFAWANGISGLGTTFGAAVGVAVNGLIEMGDVAAGTSLIIVVALGFTACNLVLLRRFSFDETIEHVLDEGAPQEQDADALIASRAAQAGLALSEAEAVFSARCEALARQHELTPREAEVFAMLARGRNREYIEEHLHVSRNTVKAHVKHVYAKLDIHSHQELLDCVENTAAPSSASSSSV